MSLIGGGKLIELEVEEVPTPTAEVAGKSPAQIAFTRLRHDKVAVLCFSILVLMVLIAISAPLIAKAFNVYWDIGNPKAPNPSDVLDFDGYPSIGPPYNSFTWSHPLGVAPHTGADNLAYLVYGLRTSLGIATSATILTTIVGVGIGLVWGFSRGWVDQAFNFVVDLFLAFPFFLGLLALVPIITSHYSTNVEGLPRAQLFSLLSVLVVLGWMGLARLIRGQVLTLREREFIQAAEVIGVPTRQILFKELLPNMVAPIVVSLSLSMPAFVALEAALSFLGLGLTGIPSLGKMASDATTYYADYGLYLWLPVGAIALLTLTLNLLGDAVRDAFDPRTRR